MTNWLSTNPFRSNSVGDDVRRELGEEPTMLDASRLVTPPGLRGVDEPAAVYYFQRARAWMLKTSDEGAARRVAAQAHKKLVGKRSLTASDPFLHHMPLYVAYPGGYVKAAGLPEKKRETSKADAKHRILRKGKDTFGARGVKLTGSEGAYRLEIRPARKEFRGKFGATAVTAPTLDEIEKKLDGAIEKVEALL